MMNGKELSPVSLPYLPDDLLWSFLARVSRLYYPTLSLVSKRFRSLIASMELYENRALLGRTESCLYIYFPLGSYPINWFTLCRRPTRIPNPNPRPNSRWFTCCFRPYSKKEKKSSDNIMISIRTHNSSISCYTLIAVGSNIYNIGGYINGAVSSRVFSMDCRSHTWHEIPSMWVARKHPRVTVLDGKIYVVEGFNYYGSSNSIECFDPKTQTWEDLPIPGAEIRGSVLFMSLAIEGKLYLFGDKSVVYKPNENRWDMVELEIHILGMEIYFCLNPHNICVIDNILYCFRSSKKLECYDFKIRSWKILKGLEELLERLPKNNYFVRLVNYGGKIAVLWEENMRASSEKKKIWCAEITLEKHNEQEIYGKVEWCNVVLIVPKSYSFMECIAATV